MFTHPSELILAGVQTPGGTIDLGETPRDAAFREALEETGLTGFQRVELIAQDEFEGFDEKLVRYFFQMDLAEPAPDSWVHIVQGGGIDQGMEFTCRWVDLPEAGDLAEHFHAHLDCVTFEA